MEAKGLTPILNVSDIASAFAWFEKWGWKKLWDWGTPPTFGAVGAGKETRIFLCQGAQGGRGRGANTATFQRDGDEEGDKGVWMSIWVDDVDEMDHQVGEDAAAEIPEPAPVAEAILVEGLLRRAGLYRLLPRPLRQLHDMVPWAMQPGRGRLPEVLPAEGHRRARVALFTGCAGDAFLPQTTVATARVLQRNGCEVWVPRRQVCCGALHYHAAREAPAQQFAAANCDVFGNLEQVDAIITNAAGCGALREHVGKREGRVGFPRRRLGPPRRRAAASPPARRPARPGPSDRQHAIAGGWHQR